MNKLAVFFILVMIIVGAIAFFYYKYELPNSKKLHENQINVSISARYNQQLIKVPVTIKNSETIHFNTSKTYQIFNLKKGKYTIYTNSKDLYNEKRILDFTDSKENNSRIDLKLTKPEKINYQKYINNSLIKLSVSSENFRDLHYCIIYSFGFIGVQTNDTKTNLLEKYKSYDKCYKTNKSLIKSNHTIYIEFDTFGVPDNQDFINISLIDMNLIDGTPQNYYKRDLGQKDLIIKLI